MKKIISFIFLIGMISLPYVIFSLYPNVKSLINYSNYEVKQVTITLIEALEDSDGSSPPLWVVYYNINNNEKSVSIPPCTDEMEHFNSLFYEFEDFPRFPNVGDVIQVWHNSNAKDFYAMNNDKQYLYRKIINSVSIRFLFFTIGIVGIFLEINRRKNKRKHLI